MYRLLDGDKFAASKKQLPACSCGGVLAIDEKTKHGLVCTCSECGNLSFWWKAGKRASLDGAIILIQE